MKKLLFEIKDLTLGFGSKPVLNDVNFKLYSDEILGIVGESGSGKTVTCLALMGLLPQKTTQIHSGIITFEDQNVLDLSNKDFEQLRGNEISMIFQEPMSSLNPSMTCGRQVAEILQKHTSLSREEIKLKVLSLFEQVKLPRPESIYGSYPHQISGGQKQRVMIAMAIACDPKVLIADEPTTALDVTVQKEIILLLKEIQQRNKMSVIFITHDLALVGEIADRILVMYQGEIVESGPANSIFSNPKNQYTQALIAARPKTTVRQKRLLTVGDFMKENAEEHLVTPEERHLTQEAIYAKQPLIEIKNLNKTYISHLGFFRKKSSVKAVNDVSFKIYEGETLGLVGESGCGKSTLGNVLLNLDHATSGEILYRGKELSRLSKNEMRRLRSEVQIIFQDPYSSLNPRITVGQALTEAMKVHKIYNTATERKEAALQLLEKVGLQPEHYYRYPHEFSGGQRQRIGIARTIAVKPKFIVCDESVSALDISVQAQVLNLLNDLKDDFGFTYLFISHDLAVVKYFSDRVIIMRNGKIEEIGEADSVYNSPSSPYTQELINSIPKGI